MKKILLVVGARPNFMKIAPVYREIVKGNHFEPILIHTGQHYDDKMSKIFFDDLELPKPDFYLGVGSGSHAQQTAKVMIALEEVMIDKAPDVVVVVGDVNSTLAASVVASKLHIPIVHIEAGLRSFDRTMPEEINRLLTDSISDLLFITEESGRVNLRNEGVAEEKIHFVGNVMIDSLLYYKDKAATSTILSELKLVNKEYTLVTLHRPSNVDDHENFRKIIRVLAEIQTRIPVIFPIHPRTRKMIHTFGLDSRVEELSGLQLVDPVGYLDFLKLMMHAKLVLTDSGGIQEETTALSIPCLTLRENTERPVTIEIGTNKLVGADVDRIIQESLAILDGRGKSGNVPPLWDGKAAERIVQVLMQKFI
ncbi:UDP-N-acetylglucosamine 2-epimerase (non-hydrolyzing) [candidate division KSB1 bacterium]|nr:UDP-N-acetylglucosamine 2-epimerase (non-hydrolyzing) [candidate division KSB1 bacterium]